jgi:predicted Zn-dependent protease
MRAIMAAILMVISLGATPGPSWASQESAISDLFVQGRTAAAVRAAQRAVRSTPGSASARLWLAKALLEAGDAENAQVALDAARERGIDPMLLVLPQAHVRLLWGDAQGAMVLIRSVPLTGFDIGYRARLLLRAHAALGQWKLVAQDVAQASTKAWAGPSFWVDLAQINQNAGNLAGAYQALDRALKGNANFGPALALGGELARRRYGLVASLAWQRRAAALDPGNVGLKLDLAATLGDLGANQEMLAVTRAVQRMEPRNAWAFYFQAVMAARAGQFGLAQSLLQRMGERLADRPGVQLLRGAVHIQLGLPDRAVAALSLLVAQQPGNFMARRLLARAASQASDPGRVLEALGPMMSRADADGYALMLAGRATEAQGRAADASVLLARASQRQRRSGVLMMAALSPAPDPFEAQVRLVLGQLAAGNAQAARGQAIAVRDANPGNAQAHMLVGDVEAVLKNWPAAAAAYQASANLEFSEAAVLRLSRALFHVGQGEQAQRLWGSFLSQNPQNIVARLVIGHNQMVAGQWPAAVAGLEVLRARLGNHHIWLMVALSQGWLEMGNAPQAQAYAQSARSDLPFQPDVRVALARAAMAAGNRAQARRLLRAALADPTLEDRRAAALLLTQL